MSVYPKTFDQIVADFIQLNGIYVSAIQFKGAITTDFVDPGMAKKFSDYHRDVCELRLISATENLTQPKSKRFKL